MMQVTKIEVDNINPKESGICAQVTIIFDNVLCVNNIHVINGKKGLFIAFPNTGQMRLHKGAKRYKDIVHPLSKSFRKEIEAKVLQAYEEKVSNL